MRYSIFCHLGLVALLIVGLPLCAEAADPNPPSIYSTQGAWKITRQWTPAETQHYAKWLEHIYKMKTEGTVEQRMAKVPEIVTDPEMNLLEDPTFRGEGSNPQLPRNVLNMVNSMIDCAKFTSFMPAYYAYRRGLPWMSAYVASGGGDVRTADANTPVGSANSFTTGSLYTFFKNCVGGFNSGNYRVEVNGRNSHLSDTVPVAIDPEYLMPGIVNYIDGHCLLLARVSDYGELQFINASTTTTRDIYTYNGMNTVSGVTPAGQNSAENPWKGCFQGLRVPRYPIAETNSDGKVIKVRRRTDDEMRAFGFSTEQYSRMQDMWEKQQIDMDGLKPKTYHDFIRLRMMKVDQIVPLAFLEEYTDEPLDVYRFREDFVQDAWQNYKQQGPVVYPEQQENANIFQAHGRWETWSSPSSDVDRRNKYFYLADWLRFAIDMFGLKPEFVDLEGLEQYDIRSQAGLAKALLAEKKRLFDEHKMQYTKSNGAKVTLSLSQIEDRLYDLSFDPNHPPELRWGAKPGTEEFAGAPETYTPVPSGARVAMMEAYELQSYYRSVSLRETEMSVLRGMFTDGYPVLDKVDTQIGRCLAMNEPTPEIREWLRSTGRDVRQAHNVRSAPRVQQVSDPAPSGTPPLRTVHELDREDDADHSARARLYRSSGTLVRRR